MLVTSTDNNGSSSSFFSSSFDVLRDSLGLVRTEFPHTVYCVARTQAEKSTWNLIGIFKLSNISGKRRDLVPDKKCDETDMASFSSSLIKSTNVCKIMFDELRVLLEEKSARNSVNRSKLSMPHPTDRKPIREIIYELVKIQVVVQSESSLTNIQVVERCFGPHARVM
ncbi:PREDICTED: uncharacterized protein LOC109241682 isoform X1 [Nicotiana attenuata]|uniref:uncharacterized protein LOC109241682 isoform X1 n=1 Tax=Nicotiana attenuata TaxID=49451 RepID=UPI00090483B7|nr:PREDICTED: uncharacterized protein LOC109241682 isoform X1 [Nicotiana attenuata]XP_019263988.1 PREDICTED: uncharacterized protein LOC109241682 isoform X1 [Nicotiana attenuata]